MRLEWIFKQLQTSKADRGIMSISLQSIAHSQAPAPPIFRNLDVVFDQEITWMRNRFVEAPNKQLVNPWTWGERLGLGFGYLATQASHKKKVSPQQALAPRSPVVRALGWFSAFHPFASRCFQIYDELPWYRDQFAMGAKGLVEIAEPFLSEGEMKSIRRHACAMLIQKNLERASSHNSAIAALALIEPLIDDPMDRGDLSEESVRQTRRMILGQPASPQTGLDEAIFRLYAALRKSYPLEDHPFLTWSLSRLYDVNWASSQLQRQETSDSDLLFLTLAKSALAMMAIEYITLGNLNEHQARFFMNIGGALQLLDDFEDVKTDQGDGIDTLWTRAEGDSDLEFLRMHQYWYFHLSILNRFKAGHSQAFLSGTFIPKVWHLASGAIVLRALSSRDVRQRAIYLEAMKPVIPMSLHIF